MTRESEFRDLMLADALLPGLLPGGIYTDQEVGVEGIRRGASSPTADAFDARGALLTCAIVREGGLMPYGNTYSLKGGSHGTIQQIYVYFYEMRGKEEVTPAKNRTKEIMNGTRLSDSYPIWWNADSPPIPDDGPIMNATVVRQDWTVIGFNRGTA
jgi:hypothetical protein